MARFKTWWQTRAPRERWILAVGGALAAVLLLYGLIWLPLARERERLRQQVLQGERDLAWMQSVPASALRSASAMTLPGKGESLLSRLDRGARAAGLGDALLAVEPVGDGEVRMRFQNVDFDALIGWLQGQAKAGIVLRELSAQRAAMEGRSDVRVALGEGAAP